MFERCGQHAAGGDRDAFAVPEPAMCEQVIVLALVPRAVGEHRRGQVSVQSAGAINRAVQQVVITGEATGSHQRGIVPHLPIGHPFVERRNERDTRLNDAIAHAPAECGDDWRWRTGLEEVQCDDELQQPDRFQVRAEERARRSEYIVDVGIPKILLGKCIKECDGQRAALGVVGQYANERRVHHALGEPQLVPVHAKAIVCRTFRLATTLGTEVPRVEWVEGQEGAIDRAAASFPAQHCLLARHLGRRREQGFEFPSQSAGQGREISVQRGAPCREVAGRGEYRHLTSPRGARRQSCSVTSSPRRSMWTPRTRSDMP